MLWSMHMYCMSCMHCVMGSAFPVVHVAAGCGWHPCPCMCCHEGAWSLHCMRLWQNRGYQGLTTTPYLLGLKLPLYTPPFTCTCMCITHACAYAHACSKRLISEINLFMNSDSNACPMLTVGWRIGDWVHSHPMLAAEAGVDACHADRARLFVSRAHVPAGMARHGLSVSCHQGKVSTEDFTPPSPSVCAM